MYIKYIVSVHSMCNIIYKRREACIVGSGRATEGYRPYGRRGHKDRIILKCSLIEWISVD